LCRCSMGFVGFLQQVEMQARQFMHEAVGVFITEPPYALLFPHCNKCSSPCLHHVDLNAC
jgi:hypothetical protein